MQAAAISDQNDKIIQDIDGECFLPVSVIYIYLGITYMKNANNHRTEYIRFLNEKFAELKDW